MGSYYVTLDAWISRGPLCSASQVLGQSSVQISQPLSTPCCLFSQCYSNFICSLNLLLQAFMCHGIFFSLIHRILLLIPKMAGQHTIFLSVGHFKCTLHLLGIYICTTVSCVCVYVYVEVKGQLQVVFLRSRPFCYLKDLPFAWRSPIRLGWLTSKPQDSFISPPWC